jgi:hypothetical protein
MPDPLSNTISRSSPTSDFPAEPPTCFTVVSIPTVQMVGGDRFTTELTFTFRRRAAGMGGGVRAVCSFRVAVKIWGLQSAIEPVMMAEAKKSLAAFFPFMAEYFHLHGALPESILEGTAPSRTACVACLHEAAVANPGARSCSVGAH